MHFLFFQDEKSPAHSVLRSPSLISTLSQKMHSGGKMGPEEPTEDTWGVMPLRGWYSWFCIISKKMEVGSKALITLTVISRTFQIFGECCRDLVAGGLRTIWGITWLVKASVLDFMKLLYFFTGSCFDFTEGCKATMTRDGLPMKDACSQRVFGDAGSALLSRRPRVFGGCRICTPVT